MAHYIPHNPADVKKMLQAIGVSSLDELFTDIPGDIRLSGDLNIPLGISEYEAQERLRKLAEKNMLGTSFLGCGSYDHIIPAAVPTIVNHPAFVTAYTPYQAEMSQGLLQAIFEYQTYITQLTGLEVSNASLYDGHTAAAEAASIAFQSKKKGKTLLVSQGVHPYTIDVLQTYYGEDYSVKIIPLKGTATDWNSLNTLLDDDVVGVLAQSPNFLGTIEDFTGVADKVHDKKGLFMISVNPMTLGVLATPADWGADIAVGDTQPFGLAPCFGGPSVGFIAATQKLLRKIPGRIVGETVDTENRRSFVLTLQAREQHIKRSRATSNICSNQALAAIATTAYLGIVGFKGLQEVGDQSMSKARYLRDNLMKIDGIEAPQGSEFFHEFIIEVAHPERFLNFLQEQGVFGGVHLGVFSSEWANYIAVAVTEKRSKSDLDQYVALAKEAVHA